MDPEVYAKNPVILHVSKLNGEKKKLRIWSRMTSSGSVGCGLPSSTQYPMVDLAVNVREKVAMFIGILRFQFYSKMV